MIGKHSPGPFSYPGRSLIRDANGAAFAIVQADEVPGRDTANGNLLAASLDLLEALEGLDDAYCRAGRPLTRAERAEDRKRLMAARAAIAKARGE